MAVDPRKPWEVVEEFERALAEYTGAPHVVCVDSCTNALRLCFKRRTKNVLTLPAHTYVGVFQSARHSAMYVDLKEIVWEGEYTIPEARVVDAAKWLRARMYRPGTLTCLSFQAFKQLPIGRGGAILCDDALDAEWFRCASFDGRRRALAIAEQKEFGWGVHCYLPPPDAARGLWLMRNLVDDAQPIGSWRDYPDLREKVFA